MNLRTTMFLAATGGCGLLAAQDGAPWTSFGANGVAANYITWESDPVAESVCQADGRIITVSKYSDLLGAISGVVNLSRFNLYGDLDTTYGVDGIASINFCTSFDFVTDMVLQPDGKLVACGYESFEIGDPNIGQIVTFRVDTNGTLDPTYGTGGVTYVLALPPNDNRGMAIDVAPDGKIIGCGYGWNGSVDEACLFRYTESGILDSTFGAYGIVALPGAAIRHPNDLVVQDDGKIVITGNGSTGQAAVMRFLANGAPDASFGGAGTAYLPVANTANAMRLHVYDDGRILAGGDMTSTFPATERYLLLTRFLPDGTSDPSFGANGVYFYSFIAGTTENFKDMVLLADGRIMVAAQWPSELVGSDMGVACFGPDAGLVISWGGDGLAGHEFNPEVFTSKSVCVRPNGMVIASGNCPPQMPWGQGYDIALACYIPSTSFYVVGIDAASVHHRAVIAPNPVQHGQVVHVRSVQAIDRMILRGMDGREIGSFGVRWSGADILVPAAFFAEMRPGLYMLCAEHRDQSVWSAKLIVE